MTSGGEYFSSTAEPEGDAHAVQEIYLGFQGVTIALQSEHPFELSRFSELEGAVTGMSADQGEQSGTDLVDGRVTYVPADDIDVRYLEDARELVLAGPTRLFGDGTALAFTAHYMAECLRAAKSGLMLVHSAAVKTPDEDYSYVFMGEKGAGKTTLALRLCHQYNHSLIGNDQVFMGTSAKDGQLITAGGNAWFNVRETAISADPYLQRLLGVPDNTTGKPAWNNKLQVEPDTIGVSVAKGELPVKGLFHVRIDHTQSKLSVGEWTGLHRNLVLHERIGRHVTGQATPLLDDKGHYLGSLPPVELASALKARDELVGLLIDTGITEIFAPSSDAAVDYIANRG